MEQNSEVLKMANNIIDELQNIDENHQVREPSAEISGL